jgi:hypothetical protein
MVLNCTLKPSPQESNTQALANIMITEMERLGVKTTLIKGDAYTAYEVITYFKCV